MNFTILLEWNDKVSQLQIYRSKKFFYNIIIFNFFLHHYFHTWKVPYRDSACTDFPVSAPTTDSRLRNRCSIRRIRPVVPRRHPDRTTICISAPTVPSTSSSSRDSTTGIPACMRICRPVYRPPRRRRGPSGSPTMRHAPPRNEEFPRTVRRGLPSTAAHRNTCTICESPRRSSRLISQDLFLSHLFTRGIICL